MNRHTHMHGFYAPSHEWLVGVCKALGAAALCGSAVRTFDGGP